MSRVSIISLIYRSATLADWVHDSVQRFTPMIASGDAEFFFVANDPAPGLLRHLQERGYRHIVNINERHSEDELFALGYAGPEHMSRVYRGYNEGVRTSQSDYVVLINSDNFLSPDWLENLLKYSDRSRVISSTLVERNHPTFSVFPGALHGEFGATAKTFDEAGFLAFVARVKKTGLEAGGAYMPTLFHRDIALQAGLYPSGNIAGRSFNDVALFGDAELFARLAAMGVSHFTATDSISYHLKEGEREDSVAEPGASASGTPPLPDAPPTPAAPFPIKPSIVKVRDAMAPNSRHEQLVASIVADFGEAPSTRTMRQLVAAGILDPEREKLYREEIARRDESMRFEAQGARFRELVGRIVGRQRVAPALRVIHFASWIVRPLRRFAARRGR